MREEEEIRIVIRTSPEAGLELLERLARDDDFRLEIARDPEGGLKRYGIEVSPAPSSAQLASKEEFALLLDAMREADDPFGRVSQGTWRFQLLGRIFALGALPMIGRGDVA